MKLGLIETFVKYAARKNNTLTEEDLSLFEKRYNVYEAEMDEVRRYCSDHGITIVRPDGSVAEEGADKARSAERHLSEEECRKRRRMIRTIAGFIVHKGAIKARKRVEGRGWICGTYTSSIRRTIEKVLERRFSEDEIAFIYARLPKESEEETEIVLKDPENQERCEELNRILNGLIPKIYVNHYWSDFLSD